MAVPPYNLLELCAGVGGLGLGIHIAVPGAGGVAYVEREAYAAATLVARREAGELAPAPVWSDLATFDARPWRGIVDCVASGDPCQPNSVAGKRGGAADERFLIDQVLRIVGECRPHRLFRENVTGNADGQLAALVPALERLGYRVAAGIFSAAEVGASHRRERLFVMADAQDNHWRPGERGTEARAGASVQRRRGLAVGGTGFPTRPRLADARDDRCDPLGSAFEADDAGQRSAWLPEGHQPSSRGSALADSDGLGRRAESDEGESPDDARQRRTGLVTKQFFAPGPTDQRWPAVLDRAPGLEPAVRRVADGLAYRVDQLRACGNGVVSLAAARAWVALDALHAADRAARTPAVSVAA